MSSQPIATKLNPDLLQALRGIKSVRFFPKGATLFHHGSTVTGVYLVESGEVRVLLPTGQHQKQLLEVVGPGTVLGLSESMTGENYRVTAEAREETTAAFVSARGIRWVSTGTLRFLHAGVTAPERRVAWAVSKIPQHQCASGTSAAKAAG